MAKIQNAATSKPSGPMDIDASKPAKETLKLDGYKLKVPKSTNPQPWTYNVRDAK